MKRPNKAQWFSIVVTLAVLAPSAFSLGQKERLVVGTYRDEGDSGVLFSTPCVSTSWVQVVSTDTIRRGIIYQTDPDLAAATVCLSTTSNLNDQCNEPRSGVKLSTGAAYIDYSGVNFFCRARSGTVYVHGVSNRDSGDYGQVNRPR